MKPFITFLFIALFSSICFSQQGETFQYIYLRDGGYLKGNIIEDDESELVNVRLTDGSVVNLPKDMVWKAVDKKEGYVVQPDGRQLFSKGKYTSLGIQILAGKNASEFNEDDRWTAAGQFSMGYHFNQKIGLGAGVGFDFHEENFIPIFLELNGFLGKNKFNDKDFGDIFLPFSYNLQVGYNFVLHEKTEFEDITGGWLVYPSVGFVLGSRKGANFKMDIGYKFQRFERNYVYATWNEYTARDVVTFKSLAIRASWLF